MQKDPDPGKIAACLYCYRECFTLQPTPLHAAVEARSPPDEQHPELSPQERHLQLRWQPTQAGSAAR